MNALAPGALFLVFISSALFFYALPFCRALSPKLHNKPLRSVPSKILTNIAPAKYDGRIF